MNASTSSEQHGLRLVDIIDFKWLMTGSGHQVHVERLQDDADYAERCLRLAETANDPALKACARRLRDRLAQPRPE